MKAFKEYATWRMGMIWVLQGPWKVGDLNFESQLWLVAKGEKISKDLFKKLYLNIVEYSKLTCHSARVEFIQRFRNDKAKT